MPEHEIASTIIRFLGEIGIEVRRGEVSDDSFLSGIEVRNGGLIVDTDRLNFPGDILHEAGHLAVVPASVRSKLSGEVQVPGMDINVVEMAAMLWSYAACIHLQIDPTIVFHDGGYHGRAKGLLMNFQLAVYPGLHVLESAGMAVSDKNATEKGVKPFPSMLRWVRL